MDDPSLSANWGVIVALIVVGMPLLSACVLAAIGRKLPGGGDTFGIGCIGVSLAGALFLALNHATVTAHAWTFEWFSVGGTPWRVGVSLDGLTLALLVVVTLVGFLVQLFSKGYMHGDDRYTDFYRWLGFFTFSMLGLVISDNLISLFVFWELMGLSSYKLIGHYFFKQSAYMACKKAFMTTRVGDIGMFLAMLAIYLYTGSLRFQDIFAHLHLIPAGAVTWIALGLFMGAAGKSAQFPLHIWLPDAMEGPTPVSALIHAATMVAAGVYLVGRMYTLIILSPVALLVISIIGCFTALMAASIAFTRTDIKQVLAYSTVSQLGFMFTALGVGSNIAWQAGLMHLCTHAMFKAGLFLGSGSVIHGCHHEQDMTRMGGLWKKMPITGWTFLICCASIAGVPFVTAGFYSKDMILQSLQLGNGGYDEAYQIIGWVLTFVAGMTAFYMFRCFFLTFMTKPRDHHIHDHAHESPLSMTVGLMVLAGMAVVGGFLWQDIFLANTANNQVANYMKVFDLHSDEVHHAHSAAVMTSIVVATTGIVLAYLAYQTEKGAAVRKRARAAIAPLYGVAQHKFYIDEIVEYGVIRASVVFAAFVGWFDATVLDRGAVDGAGRLQLLSGDLVGVGDDALVDGAVQGTAKLSWWGGGMFSRFQSGRIRNYLFGAVATAAAIAVVALYMSGS